jgi:hypothetical protein
MPSFSGSFKYARPDGSSLQAGPCRLSLEAETLNVTPTSGTPLVIDLGDIDVFSLGDYELTLTLYTGAKIVLNQFGKTFQNLRQELLEAFRQRLLQCLLLEDLEEIARFDGFARLESAARTFSSPAEFRLYKSNLAVLPTQSTGFQWRLADIDAVRFDETTWTVTAESAGECLAVSKLAKRTEEFRERLAIAMEDVAQHAAETVHNLFPFLGPDQLQQATALLKEGRAASLSQLRAIHTMTEQALSANAVDAKLKPYFDTLLAHVPAGNYYAGFKLLREGEEQGGQEEQADPPEQIEPTSEEPTPAVGADAAVTATEPEGDSNEKEGAAPILHWFFLPLASQTGATSTGNLVAWEATSRSGRATYFFRLVPPADAARLQDSAQAPALIDAAVRQLNRAIVLLNFRREPIYLPDASLEVQPRFRRYAIACRKLPELVRLRSSFLGRAIHTTPQAWRKQFESYLAQA